MSTYREMDIDELYEIYKQPTQEYVLIDVRRPDEWAQGTIPNVERVVLDELPEYLKTLDKSKTYIMICRSGARSGRACEYMLSEGFQKPVNFSGGMLDWYDSGYDLEK